MFDKLLKSKFYTKSKSAIKLTKARIATIKRKRNAMQKYLKNDIADLLKNNLDVNSYGRVEGLWNEMNLSSCYDFVEQFCTHISSNLTIMDKQRECPDECREAASSLMFAAARFADLPELRDLRNVLLERYGGSIQHYANKEFINKLKSTTPPTKDMKLQLMQDIATESGVEWNVKILEQKLLNPSAFDKECTKGSNADERNTPDMIDAVHNMDEKDADYKLEDQRKCTSQATEMGYLSNDERDRLSNDGRVLLTRTHLSYSRQEQEANVTAVKEDDLHQRDSITEAKPKPKPIPVRTRNQKAPPGQDSIDSSDTRNSESVLEPFPQQTASNRGVRDKDSPPSRTASLPANSEAVEATKSNARACSFRPEMLSPKGHVHSKPPDYEEFVARLAAFR